MSSSQKQYKKSKPLEACKDMVESCKIPKWNCPHIWTASQLFAQLLNFGLLPQLLGSWPARTDPWCYEAWSCPRPTCASLWTWSHRIGAKEQQLGRKEPWVESSRPNSSLEVLNVLDAFPFLLTLLGWLILGHASIATSWPLFDAVGYYRMPFAVASGCPHARKG